MELRADIIDFNNNYEDPGFIKRVTIVTIIVLVLNLIITNLWMMFWPAHNTMGSKFSLFLTTILLMISIIFFKAKKSTAKITSLIAAALIVFNFNILSILLGLYYFTFIIDEEIINNIVNFIKSINNKIKNKKK